MIHSTVLPTTAVTTKDPGALPLTPGQSISGKALSVQFVQSLRTMLFHSSSFAGALTLALMLGLNPLLGSAIAHAQEGGAVTSVNINSADAEALAAGLKGVGIGRAQEIIRYRETYGPFGSVEELMEVKGVGTSTLENNRAVITLE